MLGVEVTDQQQGKPRFVGQPIEQLGVGVEAAGGGANSDNKERQARGFVRRRNRWRGMQFWFRHDISPR
jgi:hypothetical protein